MVVSPTSCLANVSFANVLGRCANVPSRFANVRPVNSPMSGIEKLLIDVWNAILIIGSKNFLAGGVA